MMLCIPPPSAIFFCISKGKLCQSASLACLDEARNTIFAGTNPRYTAWKGAQRSRCFEQVMQMPPKPVSWAHSESPPQTLLPYSTPSIFPRAPAEHSVERKFDSFKRNKFWPCEDLHHTPLGLPHLCKQEKIENAFDFNTLSGLQLSTHTTSLVYKQSNLNTHLQRWTLQRSPSGPIALGAAQTPPKPAKSSQPCETPHKHAPDDLDVGNKILQYLCGHLSPVIFWNTFFHKTPAVSDTSERLQHPRGVGVVWITPDLLWVKWSPHSIICNWKWEVRVNEFSSPSQIFISCPPPQ